MKQITSHNHQSPSKLLPIPTALFALFLISLFTTSCSTATHHREILTHVFDAETDVLQKLRKERSSAPIAKKVQADPALSEAEAHLDQVIQSLMDSNNAVKAAF